MVPSRGTARRRRAKLPESGLLLDTHVLVWLFSGGPLSHAMRVTIEAAQQQCHLSVSPISGWEVAVSLMKVDPKRRPDLAGLDPGQWFSSCVARFQAVVIPMDIAIALEAARVPAFYQSGDPGDCFLIATARVHNLTLMTRDARILQLSASVPEYLSTIAC